MPYISRFVKLYRAGRNNSWQANRRLLRLGASLGFVTALSTGLSACGGGPLSGNINQLLLAVEPGDSPGVYQLSGATDLPEDTQLIVQAVRHLTPTGQLVSEDRPEEHYAILDRDRALVRDGRWEVELQLWENNGGEPVESWQMRLPQSDRSFIPDNQVRFTVSMPPTGDERALESQWQQSKQRPDDGVVRFTPDGEWFLQAEESIAINPPNALIPEQPNSFSARKDFAQVESDLPKAEVAEGLASKAKATTDAPLDDSELLR